MPLISFRPPLAALGLALLCRCSNSSDSIPSGEKSSAEEVLASAPVAIQQDQYQPIQKSDWGYMKLMIKVKRSRSYSSDYSEDAAWNVLFINPITRQHRLLVDSSRTVLISSIEQAGAGQSDGRETIEHLPFLLLATREGDTNGDGKLTQRDAEGLAICRLDGTGMEWLTEPGMEVSYRQAIDSGRQVMMIVSRDENRNGDYDDDRKSIYVRQVLPKVGALEQLVAEEEFSRMGSLYRKAMQKIKPEED